MFRTNEWGNDSRCRFCLLTKRCSTLLSASAQAKKFKGLTYWDMLVKISSDKAVKDKTAPQNICLQCSVDVKKCFTFIMMCENSEQRIVEELNFKKVIKEEVKLINVSEILKPEIKTEIKQTINQEDEDNESEADVEEDNKQKSNSEQDNKYESNEDEEDKSESNEDEADKYESNEDEADKYESNEEDDPEVETLIIKVTSEHGDSSSEMDVDDIDLTIHELKTCIPCGIDFNTETDYFEHLKREHDPLAVLDDFKNDISKVELKIIPNEENAKKVKVKIIHHDENKRKFELLKSKSGEAPAMVVPVGDPSKRRHKKGPKHLRKCDYCKDTFYLYEYTEHLREKHADKSIGCTYCEKLYFHPGILIAHVRKFHPEEKFQCAFCEFTADVHRIYFEHMRDAHKEIFLEKKCDFCDYTSYSALCLGTHMMKMHEDKMEFKCEQCDRKFFDMKKLKSHKKTHAEKERSYCDICGRSYKNKWDLQNHMDGHKEEKHIECDVCHKKFNRVDHYTLHRRCHSEEKNYKCDDCGSAYRYNSSLLKHRQMVHVRTKTYTCPYCGKVFRSADQLRMHKKRHAGIKNYKCLECGKGFVRSTELKQHSVVHTGERRHVCDKCGKAFTQAHVLRSHMAVHK